MEVFAYFSPAHAYSLHVSFLGLSVILMSDNESLKQEATARLEAGELFALAISERVHGADLFAKANETCRLSIRYCRTSELDSVDGTTLQIFIPFPKHDP